MRLLSKLIGSIIKTNCPINDLEMREWSAVNKTTKTFQIFWYGDLLFYKMFYPKKDEFCIQRMKEENNK